jgi:tetratricopeptide (TPR) repeat protein
VPRRSFAALALACACGCGPPPKPAAKTAHDYYVQALLEFQVEQWDEARRDFEIAYVMQPDAALLFDIGQTNRRLGRCDTALQNYRDYLAALPDSPKRASIEQLIVETKRQLKSPSCKAQRGP